MTQRLQEIRLYMLTQEKDRLEKNDPSQKEKITELHWRTEECRDWLKVMDEVPGYGKLITIDGVRVPKMPVFKTKEEIVSALTSEPSAKTGMSVSETRAARERLSREHAATIVHRSGHSPYAEEFDGEHK